jgi:hypothetical protein
VLRGGCNSNKIGKAPFSSDRVREQLVHSEAQLVRATMVVSRVLNAMYEGDGITGERAHQRS